METYLESARRLLLLQITIKQLLMQLVEQLSRFHGMQLSMLNVRMYSITKTSLHDFSKTLRAFYSTMALEALKTRQRIVR